MKRAAVPSILVVVVLLPLGVTAEAQLPKKVPRIALLFPPARPVLLNWSRRFDKGYANTDTWRNRTSSRGTLKVTSNASQVSLLSLSVLRRT